MRTSETPIGEKRNLKIPENFLRKIPEKFSGISQNLFSYSIPLKIRKLGDQVQRISKEFPEKHSGEFLENISFIKFPSKSINTMTKS